MSYRSPPGPVFGTDDREDVSEAHVDRTSFRFEARNARLLIDGIVHHAAGVVHRDLKPDNVFLVKTTSGSPSVRVLDFGIAKLLGADGPTTETGLVTEAGSMLGTPCYMSPEQSFSEKPVDYRTDIWSLGVILYECLTGARPVEGDSIGQVVKRLICNAITPISVVMPSLPADMTALIDSMLAREPEQRPRDLSEVSAVLRRHTTARAPLPHGSGRSSSASISPPSKRVQTRGNL